MNNKKKKIYFLTLISAILPTFSLAAENHDPFSDFLRWLLNMAPQLMQVGIVLAGLGFMYSLTIFILNPENKEYGKTVMIWGLLALFIMFSFLAIIDYLQKMIFVDGMGTPTIPNLPAYNSPKNN